MVEKFTSKIESFRKELHPLNYNDKITKEVDYYTLKPSSRSDKKYMLITPDGKSVHFGAQGMNDFTLFEDREQAEKRKKAYI